MMTVDLVTTPGTTAVAAVARLMLESGIRHVLVREDAGRRGPAHRDRVDARRASSSCSPTAR